MKPEEKSREKEICSDTFVPAMPSEARCWLMPSLPNAVRRRNSVTWGGSVMMLTTPPTASAPYRVEPDPRITSTRSTLSSGTGISILKCPVCGSLRRMPLSSTSVLPKPAPRMERSLCTPLGARSSRSSEGSSLSRSVSVLSTRVWLRAGSTRMARSISSSDMGSKVPVTTTVSRCCGCCWARASTEVNARRRKNRRCKPYCTSASRYDGFTMNWNDAAEDLLNLILGQTPYPVREATEAQIRGTAEALAEAESKSRVGVETVIAAWVRSTPETLRPDLPRLMEKFGLDADEYRHLLE